MQQQNNEVCILLGVWGESFINNFLELSLASLLAPGNIPALAKQYKTRFIFLTRSYDVAVFESHPAFARLKAVCDIEFISINDLIVLGNYSTTLTLAYDRAVRQSGEAMLNTYFIFLTSDYIVADGSFTGLMRYMQQGYSGIQAGNFQVIKEDIEPYLLQKINPDTHVMAISPRELLANSVDHLHPVTLTSFADQQLAHNYFANRFFCQHDTTIAGRFYLLHMLCIKPETIDYQVGASCDYSFIPEMCPSGNFATITDSDDYLVVEIQARGHELEYIQWGHYNPQKLTVALAEWTTKHHRENADQILFYHQQDLSNDEKKLIKNKLNALTNPIHQALAKYPVAPSRNHPYWIGAISSFAAHQKLINHTEDEFAYFDLTSLSYLSYYRKLFHRYFGLPPAVFRWHFRWRDYTSARLRLKNFTANYPDKTLTIYHSYLFLFMRYSKWLKEALGIKHHYHIQNISQSEKFLARLQSQTFERCILPITITELKKLPAALAIVKDILTSNGEVLLLIPNEKNHCPTFIYDIKREFFFRMNYVRHKSFEITDIATIHDNFTHYGSTILEDIARRFNYNKKIRFLLYFLIGVPGTIVATIRNCFSRASNHKKTGHCTNILITMKRCDAPRNQS